ncbi:hypothetical protein BCR43DRAFT_213260 [Syncephalastrum racemosum]|uniref:Uncharacterized protein n=1 Tax=Syncephalastrum racemosum TaxID=13706 RepID=A0A1X2HIN6_SYNRA|nr:hypothetical protein BCR43DRAFT_213260 [Syncephalastrum racemosum]
MTSMRKETARQRKKEKTKKQIATKGSSNLPTEKCCTTIVFCQTNICFYRPPRALFHLEKTCSFFAQFLSYDNNPGHNIWKSHQHRMNLPEHPFLTMEQTFYMEYDPPCPLFVTAKTQLSDHGHTSFLFRHAHITPTIQ